MVAGFAAAATVVAAVGAGGWAIQRRLIYLPAGQPPPVERVLPGARAVTLTTDDGLDLEAWYLPAGPTAAIVFPGNGGNRAGRAPLARALADLGLSVLLVDYRGYGGNAGSPSEEGLAADARAARTWIDEQPDVERIVYFGESLGGAVATGLAVDRPPDALILRSPFTSLVDVARVHYGPVPEWVLRDRFRSIDRIDDVDVPVLVLAGEGDTIVPFDHSRRLYEAASEPKRFVALTGGHNDPALFTGEELLAAVGSFLRDTLDA